MYIHILYIHIFAFFVLDNIFLIFLPPPSQYKIIHHHRPPGPGRGGQACQQSGCHNTTSTPSIISQNVYKTYITIVYG